MEKFEQEMVYPASETIQRRHIHGEMLLTYFDDITVICVIHKSVYTMRRTVAE